MRLGPSLKTMASPVNVITSQMKPWNPHRPRPPPAWRLAPWQSAWSSPVRPEQPDREDQKLAAKSWVSVGISRVFLWWFFHGMLNGMQKRDFMGNAAWHFHGIFVTWLDGGLIHGRLGCQFWFNWDWDDIKCFFCEIGTLLVANAIGSTHFLWMIKNWSPPRHPRYFWWKLK
jgi:hypothetical protein